MYCVRCHGPRRLRWASDEAARRFDHSETETRDGNWLHEFVLLGEAPAEALTRVRGALSQAGSFDRFSVSDSPPHRAEPEPGVEPQVLDAPARSVIRALLAGPKPTSLLRADPAIAADGEDLVDVLRGLLLGGYISTAERLGHIDVDTALAEPDQWWSLIRR